MTERELINAIRELATEWANQSNDYDEDTEQQIDDGRVLLGLLDGLVEDDLPLGYVTLAKIPLLLDGYRYEAFGSVLTDAAYLEYRKRFHPLAEGEYVLAEVRELGSAAGVSSE